MKVRGIRIVPLLVAAAAALSFPSCSANVGQVSFHGEKNKDSAKKKDTEQQTAATTEETTTTTTTTTTTMV